jgi:kynurenine formamidase
MSEAASPPPDGRWKVRPEGSNWGDFGPDDQIGRLNLITPERRRAAVAEVREGIAFCLSLPLDCPAVPINPRRLPPQFSYSMRGDDPAMNYPYQRMFPGVKDAVCDDRVQLTLQYSTQWDGLCHMGYLYDGQGTGQEEVTYYNGYRAHDHVRSPYDYLRDREPKEGPYGAHKLGIQAYAETGLQGRGVMVDFHTHVGLERVPVGYDRLMRIFEADKVEIEPGDIMCVRTGFDRALLAQYADRSAEFDPHRVSGLDGFDDRLLQWVEDSGVAAICSDNEAVEMMPDFEHTSANGSAVPLHNKCLFKLGIPLGEMFLLSDLADWLRGAGRNRFLFTAPPLRLPGAVGSPVTGVGTV